METLKNNLRKKYSVGSGRFSIDQFVLVCVKEHLNLARKIQEDSLSLDLNEFDKEVYGSLCKKLNTLELNLKLIHHPIYWTLFSQDSEKAIFKTSFKKDQKNPKGANYVLVNNQFDLRKTNKLSKYLREIILNDFSNYYISKFERFFENSNNLKRS